MKKFQLKRIHQCAKCPWKVSTNPYDIPDWYSEEKHKELKKTIAKDLSYTIPDVMHLMACHHSTDTEKEHCVGWLNNQLGEGNNIPLRLLMMGCENINEITVYGKQHRTFEETLPKNKTNGKKNSTNL